MKQGLLTNPRADAIAAHPIYFAGAAYLFLAAHWVSAATVNIDPSQTVVLVESSHNPSNESETIRSAVALPGGGIFATGIREKEHLWSLKVAADGSLAWKTIHSNPNLENPFVAGVSSDGGYWVA